MRARWERGGCDVGGLCKVVVSSFPPLCNIRFSCVIRDQGSSRGEASCSLRCFFSSSTLPLNRQWTKLQFAVSSQWTKLQFAVDEAAVRHSSARQWTKLQFPKAECCYEAAVLGSLQNIFTSRPIKAVYPALCIVPPEKVLCFPTAYIS
jgi:hypothetical protein